MTTPDLSDQVRGKTIRLSWADGPTKGTTQEHVFHTDGTVEWHSVGGATDKSKTSDGKAKSDAKPEKPKYSASKVTDDVCMVSYLSRSGYTLTVTLQFSNHKTVGVASNESGWFPVHGSFELVN